MHKRMNKINNFIKKPHSTQHNVFNYLIRKAAQSSFGREHNFNHIIDYSSFVKNIPVRTYEEFYSYIQRSREGEKDVLWPGKVKWFAKSSGTTNSISKYIPVTKNSLVDCHFKAGKDMLSLYGNNFVNMDIYNGKGLMLGGSICYSNDGKFKDGDLSAILLDEFPFWVNHHRVPDIETALMAKWEEKLERIATQSIHENITNLTGVPSWMLILLKRILKKSGKKNILEVWPNLELYMHGGINFEPYREKFKELIPGSQMNYIEGYNASEGFFAIQDKSNSEGLLLLLDHGILFEFIPMSIYKNGSRKTILLKNVQLNVNYVIVISTNGGLWRYIIGDIIRFTSLKPFRVKVTGRTKSYINTFGEELIVENTDTALLKTCHSLKCEVKDYTVAPIFIDENSGGHQWLIEFENTPVDLNLFTFELDKNLKKLNSDYAAKRSENLIMNIPEIILLEKGTFYRWLSKNNRLGGQYKIPKLCSDRNIVEDILACRKKFSTKT